MMYMLVCCYRDISFLSWLVIRAFIWQRWFGCETHTSVPVWSWICQSGN